jgi:hypothetical protein
MAGLGEEGSDPLFDGSMFSNNLNSANATRSRPKSAMAA